MDKNKQHTKFDDILGQAGENGDSGELRKLNAAEVAVHRQRMMKLLKEQDSIQKAQHLLRFRHAQETNPIKPRQRPRRKRGRKK